MFILPVAQSLNKSAAWSINTVTISGFLFLSCIKLPQENSNNSYWFGRVIFDGQSVEVYTWAFRCVSKYFYFKFILKIQIQTSLWIPSWTVITVYIIQKKWARSSHFPSSRYMCVCARHVKQFLFLFCRSTVYTEIIYNHCPYLLSHYFFSITNFVCLYIWPKETCLFIISKLSCPFFIKDLITSGSEISLFSLKASLIRLVAYIL